MLHLLVQILLLVIGFVMLIKGADAFVGGAENLACKLGIPQIVIGLTIVAMGTSAPEAAVSITAALQGSADITIGNVVGSNIMNVLVILGLTAVIRPIAVEKSTLKKDIPFVIISTLVLMFLGFNDEQVSFVDALIILILFVGYLAFLFLSMKKEDDDVNKAPKPVWQSLLMLVLGLVFIILGSKLAVAGASEIGVICGLSEKFIGLTIVALGTSLPELCTSVSAARRGNSDIAMGNIVGSNLFNILFIVGLTGIITPVPMQTKFFVDFIVSIAAMVIILLGTFKTKKLGRAVGFVMLAAYIVYFAYIFYN